jgi:hypothetical protein
LQFLRATCKKTGLFAEKEKVIGRPKRRAVGATVIARIAGAQKRNGYSRPIFFEIARAA